MPFPLAHPAAVLPFQRRFPHLLCFPALVVGSVIPDVGYLGNAFHLDARAHSLTGLFTFCVPAGVATVLLLYAGRKYADSLLPAWLGRILSPLRHAAAPSFVAVLLSVVVGAATHLLWDSFTHRDGWLTQRSAWLQQSVLQLEWRHLRVCHVCWYASTLAGVTALALAYQRWRGEILRPATPVTRRRRWTDASVLGFLVVPVGFLHHLLPGPLGGLLVAGTSASLILGFAWRVERGLAKSA